MGSSKATLQHRREPVTYDEDSLREARVLPAPEGLRCSAQQAAVRGARSGEEDPDGPRNSESPTESGASRTGLSSSSTRH